MIYQVVTISLLMVVQEGVLQLVLKGKDASEGFEGGGTVAGLVMSTHPLPYCSLIFISDIGESSKNLVLEEMIKNYGSRGISTFDVTTEANGNFQNLSLIMAKTRKVRRWLSWNTYVVVLSRNIDFLKVFAKASLDGRFLMWETRLIVLTSIPTADVEDLLMNYWTFSMMNTLLLNFEDHGKGHRWNIYAGMPFTPYGRDVINLGFWTSKRGLSKSLGATLFQEKYDNYYGATINITALPFPPHWIVEEVEHPNGTVTEKYKGTDAFLLQSIAKVLNFTYQNVVVQTWLECEERVSERVAFLSPVYYVILPNRMKLHDYTFTYEFMSPAICALKPTFKAQWESLYYPLSNLVWLFIIVVVVVFPLLFVFGNHVGTSYGFQPKIQVGVAIEVLIGTLFSQPLTKRLPDNSSVRVALLSWLIFAFIVGAAYRGNLIASLTLSKSPPRPETIDAMNDAFDTVLMPPHGNEFKAFFEMPGSAKTFKELARRMVIGTKPIPGLQEALTGKVAYMDGRRFGAYHIAKYFTNADGSTKLYQAREDVLAGMSAWAIPHDAPFQKQIDFLMMAAIEGGLYEKWNEDILGEVRIESQRRERQLLEELQKEGKEPDGAAAGDQNSNAKSFTLVHMQGPFMLLLIGLVMSSLAFLVEVATKNVFK